MYWVGYAEYDDGTRVEKKYPYDFGTYSEDCETEHIIEWDLINHPTKTCTWYSVGIEREDEDWDDEYYYREDGE